MNCTRLAPAGVSTRGRWRTANRCISVVKERSGWRVWSAWELGQSVHLLDDFLLQVGLMGVNFPTRRSALQALAAALEAAPLEIQAVVTSGPSQ